MNQITRMTDDKLLAEGQKLLQRLHELLCQPAKTAPPKQQRAPEDRLIEVCAEIGVRQLTERFKIIIAGTVQDTKATLGRRIQRLRLAKQLTVEQLAKKAGLRVALLKRYESDKAEPHTDSVEKLADALGVGLSELVPEWIEEGRRLILEETLNELLAQGKVEIIKDESGEDYIRLTERGLKECDE
jgi:transcriptional regulator with XRE-family HTH domain